MKKIIGIDLGTTNSLVSVWEHGCAQLIPNSFGEYLTPSIVSVDTDNTVYVGKIAKERLISHPLETVSVFKRYMGTPKVFMLNEKEYRPEELSALILRRLKEDAENYLGEEVEEAVISVPAYFNDMARSATKNAGKLAGLKVERIVNEPSAAALACQQMDTKEDATLLVYDFGGGTLDVSLVDCFDNIIEIKAVSGDNHLGGYDFDRVIAQYFCEKHKMTLEEQSVELQGVILENANKLKQALSDYEKSEMTVIQGDFQGTIELSRRELIELSEALFQRMAKPIQKVLADAKVRIQDISMVVLVGGSCKMPIVKQYLKHILKIEQITEINPDHMIALGVGTYAGIKERNSEIKDMLLTDICPFSLGTAIFNKYDIDNSFMKIIIERNSPLPISKEQIFYTVVDGQEMLIVEVFQGEELYANENINLGKIEVKVPRASAGGQSITVRYTYDINGILIVDVTVNSTGNTQQLVILNKQCGISPEELEVKLKEMEQLKVHPRSKEKTRLLIARGERLYTQTTGRMREEVGERLKYMNYIILLQDKAQIARCRKEMTLFFDEIERYLNNLDMTSDNTSNWYKEEKEGDDLESTKDELKWYDGQLLQ